MSNRTLAPSGAKAMARACAAAFLLITANVAGARAQAPGPVCGARAEIVAALARDYGETPRIRARENRGSIVELFASPGGSWTLLATRPDGQVSCVVAAGTEWNDKPPAAPGTAL
jgi:hypothetical protein